MLHNHCLEGPVAMRSYSKVHIALELLEAAIAEREFHGRHFAAMNLAGVAEELLGKMVRLSGKVDQRTSAINLLFDIQAKLRGIYDFGIDHDQSAISKLLNRPKNSIKHLDSRAELDANLFFEVEQESIWLIQGAIRNLELLDLPIPDSAQQFLIDHPEESSDSNDV